MGGFVDAFGRIPGAVLTGLLLATLPLPHDARAACTSTNPASNTTVTCTGTETNPILVPAANGVTVNLEAGASLSPPASTAIELGATTTVNLAPGSLITTVGQSRDGILTRGNNSSVTVDGSISLNASAWAIRMDGASNLISIPQGGSVTNPAAGGRGISVDIGGSTIATVGGTLTGGLHAAFLSPQADTFRLLGTAAVTGVVDAFNGSDILVLGGTTDGSFNASNIGAAAQYRNFESFVKESASTWTLTGSGSQAWTVTGGALAGDTSSLAGNVSSSGVVAFSQNFNGTYSGNLSGSGSLVKSGTGTVTFSGLLTHAGGTTISAGTLASGNAIPGNITNDAILQLSPGNGTSLTLGGNITGTGAFVKTGVGDVTLNGANSFSGGTTVSAGTLRGSAASLPGNILNNGVVEFAQGAGDGTYAGNLSGSGALVKSGNASLTLTGTNTHSGGTTVQAGTLLGSTTSLQGAITNDAQLRFLQPTDGTFNGTLSGAGTVAKYDAGTLTLTGAHPLTGQLAILGGKVVLNGSIQGGVVVGSGSTFGGMAQVGNPGLFGTFAVNGTVAPGNSIGIIQTAGDVLFNNRSIYEVEIDSTGASDRIVATGAAMFQGGSAGTVSVLPMAGSYAPSTDYTILSAAGGVGGVFSGLGMNASFAFLQPSLLYVGNDVILRILNLTQPQVPGGDPQVTFESVAATGNQGAVAATLDALGTSAPFYDQLLVQSAEGARQAYDALSGEISATLPTQIIVPTGLLVDWLHDRLSGVAPSPAGGPLVLASAPLGIVSDLGPSFSMEAGQGLDWRPHVGAAAGGGVTEPLPYSAWVHGFGDLAHVAGDGDAAAAEASGGGVFVGGDLPLGAMFRVGAATGYSHQNVSVNARSSDAELDGAHAALYGTFALDGWRVRAVGAGSWQDIETHRRVQVGSTTVHPTAGSDAWTADVLGELGYAFDVSGFEIQPYAGADWVYLRTGSLSEANGGAANVTVDAASDDWITSIVGVRASHVLTHAGIGFRPRLDLGWGHTFGNLAPDRSIAFATAPALPFDISGAPLARDTARVGAGVEALVTDAIRVALEYRGDLAPDAQDHGFGLRLGLRF